MTIRRPPPESLDVKLISSVLRALLVEAGREILLEDRAGDDIVSIPFDAAAAEDGLLPVFLVAGEAIWRDISGRGFDLKLERDLGALLSWRVEAIAAENFSTVLLAMMEAIAEAARLEGVMVLDLSRVFDEATARTEARKSLKPPGFAKRAAAQAIGGEGSPSSPSGDP
jgi:hypothetical protein